MKVQTRYQDAMTLGELYQSLRKTLRDAGMQTPDLDARVLMSYTLGCAPDDMILKPDTPATMNAALEDAIARRMSHEPVSKITGRREFYGLTFKVSADVLDPRADTETLIDAARPYLRADARILDLCTGTGCILAALLTLQPGARGVAVDVSDRAMTVAQDNFDSLGLSGRVDVMQGNWLDGVNGPFDIITCNPPYIESSVIGALDADVRLHDPLLALDGGADGLNAYRAVFPQIRNCLAPNGHAFFEIGAGQAADVTRLAADHGLAVKSVHRDLGGHERVVHLCADPQAKKD